MTQAPGIPLNEWVLYADGFGGWHAGITFTRRIGGFIPVLTSDEIKSYEKVARKKIRKALKERDVHLDRGYKLKLDMVLTVEPSTPHFAEFTIKFQEA
jgi:hypothetical protein